MLRRSLLQILSFIPFLGVKSPKTSNLSKSEVIELGTLTTSPIANMTVGEFSDAKTVRMSPEELAKWDEFFKTKPIINKGMERHRWIKDENGKPIFVAQITHQELKEQFDEIAKIYTHKMKDTGDKNVG